MREGDPWDEDRYRIETPERIDLEYEVAGIGSRFLASLLDSIILVTLVVLVVVFGALGLGLVLSTGAAAAGVVDRATGVAVAYAIAGLVGFLLFWGYYVFFEIVWHGQSPGKRVVGLRVIKDGGYPIGFVDSAIRNIVRLVDFLPGYYIVGVIVMFFDRRYRRLGDLAAGTVVVKERRDLKLDSLGLDRQDGVAVDSGPSETVMPNLDRLTPNDRRLLREYFVRRTSLSPPAAATLSAHLAEAFAGRLGYDSTGERPEAFLERLRNQLRTPR